MRMPHVGPWPLTAMSRILAQAKMACLGGPNQADLSGACIQEMMRRMRTVATKAFHHLGRPEASPLNCRRFSSALRGLLFERTSRSSCGLGDIRMRACTIPPRCGLGRGCPLQLYRWRHDWLVAGHVSRLQRHVFLSD